MLSNKPLTAAIFSLLEETTGVRPYKPGEEASPHDEVSSSPPQQTPSKPSSRKDTRRKPSESRSVVAVTSGGTLRKVSLPPLPKVEHSVEAHCVEGDEEDERDTLGDYEVDPWEREDVSWSNEALPLKALYHAARKTPVARTTSPVGRQPVRRPAKSKPSAEASSFLTEDFILNYFRTLTLHDCKVDHIDEEFVKCTQLEELSLTGNWLEEVENLPAKLKVLYLNANQLYRCPNVSRLASLVHLGLGYNNIESLWDVSPVDAVGQSVPLTQTKTAVSWLPDSLLSLDLSWNALSSLDDTLDVLEQLPRLKLLTLVGNPISLLLNYRRHVVVRLPKLLSFDDVEVLAEERVEEAELGEYPYSVSLALTVETLSNFATPIPPPVENSSQPQDTYHFHVLLALPKLDDYQVETPSLLIPQKEPESPKRGKKVVEVASEQPKCMEFNFSRSTEFPVGIKLRDAVWDGVTVTLVRTRQTYTQAVQDTSTMPPSSATSRRTSLSTAPSKAPAKALPKKSGKSKRSKQDEENMWVASVVETIDVGSADIPLREFFEGKTVVSDEYELHPTDQEINEDGELHAMAGLVKLNITLNPQTEAG
ncbi:hypothetical protein BC832DRAFT_621559 [Gaertneriomyces semiglobifer]|nr:hypothetical protein BC832DRAFT_621559 [Gaertneriomyces semiglobifer]